MNQQKSPPLTKSEISIEYERAKKLRKKLKDLSPQIPEGVETTPASVSKFVIKKGSRAAKHAYTLKFE